jgi:predicted nucleic acid-binding protein
VIRFSVDTNVLFYAIDAGDPERQQVALRLASDLLLAETVLTQQVVGEYLSLARKVPARTRPAFLAQAQALTGALPLVATQPHLLFEALEVATAHRLQYWDALILAVCASAGVTHLLSEDMQDGMVVGGVTVRNPFSAEGQAELATLIGR